MIYLDSISISMTLTSFLEGSWYAPLTVNYSPSNATCKCVEWSSTNENVASVNRTTGSIWANSAGQATIIATALDGSGVSARYTITVKAKVKVQSIEMYPSEISLHKNDQYCLSAMVLPINAYNRRISWISTDPNIATVDAWTGCVTAKSAGTVQVIARATDGSFCSGTCTVNVNQITQTTEEEVGEKKVKESTYQDPIDMFTGAHLIENTLMTLYGGQGLKLIAKYDSTRLLTGVMGKGWYHNYEKFIMVTEDEIRVYNGPCMYSKYTANADNSAYTCATANKNGYVITTNNEGEYPYIINCNSDHTEYYDTNGFLAKIVDHQGFETLISYSDTLITITDTVTGKKMYLEKDTTGKVVKVYDDAARQAGLIYDGDLLTQICDLRGNALTFTYNEAGQVLTGTDAEQTCYFTNTYDSYGRVVTQKDGIEDSTVSTIVYENNGKRICTDRNGKQSIRIFDENGLLVRHTDENNNTKTYTYDTRFNITQETDAKGYSVIKTYNSFNKPTSITDKNGNKTLISYDTLGNITQIRYPEVNGIVPQESFVYNERNQLIRYTDLRGTVTVYGYDTNGMPSSKTVGNKLAEQFVYQNGLLTRHTDSCNNLTLFEYNTIGQMTKKTDANNFATVFEYDALGNLLKTVDPLNNETVTVYDCNNQKVSITDAKGYITEYAYNGNMKNTLVKLPDNNTIHYEYDGEDRVTKIIDQDNNETTTVYDNAGRVLSKTFADGATVQYEYDKVGNVVKETNPKGAVTLKTYDGQGNVLSITDNEGNITRYQYNAMGKVIREVNAFAGTKLYEYSPAGDLLSETDALGNKKTYTYDEYGNRLTFTDANGNVTTYTYDANNNLLTVRDVLGNTTTNEYDNLNQLLSVTDARGNIVRYVYDQLGRRRYTIDAKGNAYFRNLDANGNVTKITDAKGNTVTETVYNNLNLPYTVTDAQGKTTTYTYNKLGKVETATDSLNNVTRFEYNSRGNNTKVTDANNGISNAQYDLLGNVTQLSGPTNCATNYTYDNMGRLVSETTSSGGTVNYGYNELNIKESITNARGQKRKYFFDAAGRVTGYISPEDSVSYSYDANGNVLKVTDKNGTIEREYDALNRVTKYTDTYGNVIRYEYDSVGNLVKLTYPDDTAVQYTYDANNNLLTVTDWANRVTTYTYDENNRIVGIVKPNNSVVTTVYDNKQRVTSTTEKTAEGEIITGFEYVYDSLGRLSEEKQLAENRKMCYTYDNLNRVTNRTIKNLSDDTVVSSENFAYDSAGNITSAPESAYQYDANNRLTAYNGQSISYDADGNMQNAFIDCEEYGFVFDSANRLLKAKGQEYTYNAEDVRIRNKCSNYTDTYVYDTNCKLSRMLIRNTNGGIAKFVYGVGLIGEESYNTYKVYHFDSRGSTVALTDMTGAVIDTYRYDTYGKITYRTYSNDTVLLYNGRDGVVFDQNGLYYMRARYYSPKFRRFVNADIIPGEISDSTSLNRYAYVNGNPVSYVDPFGLSAERGKINSSKTDAVFEWIGDFLSLPFNLIHILASSLEIQAGLGFGFRGAIDGIGEGNSISGGMSVDLLTIKLNENEIDFGRESVYGAEVNIADIVEIPVIPTEGNYESFITGEIIDYSSTENEGLFELVNVSGYLFWGGNISISFNYEKALDKLNQFAN